MLELATTRPSAGMRAGAWLVAAAIVSGAVLVLDRALQVFITNKREPIGLVTIAARAKPPPIRRATSAATPLASAQAAAPSAMPSTVIDPQMLRALNCVTHSDGVKRVPLPDCPPPPVMDKPLPWARPNSIQKPALAREELLTFAERMTTHQQLNVCGPGGSDPPKENGFKIRVCVPMPSLRPAVKSPVEYCKAANMGGPCEPPPQERVVSE